MRIWTSLLDFLFPPECLGCGTEDVWLCPDCRKSIRIEVRRLSLQPKAFTHVWVLADYNQPLVAKAIRRFKFGYCRDLLQDLRPFMAAALEEVPLPEGAVLVPVPLHRLRRNLAAILTETPA